MSDAIYSAEKGNLRLEIHLDDGTAESPREWDNLGTMVCWHRRYNLGDEQPSSPPQEWMKELARTFTNYEELDCMSKRFQALESISFEDAQKIVDKHCVILDLYLYDHSGITMNTTGFSCPWDSGQVGWIYVTRVKVLEEWSRRRLTKKLRRKIEDLLRGEVSIYDQYIRGEVYGFKALRKTDLEDDFEDAEEEDSCWGFYGTEWEKNGLTENLSEEFKPLVKELS